MDPFSIKPLTKEAIQQLGLSTHDLWILKLDDAIYGPYETQALKDYARLNEDKFNEVQATKISQNFWKPFYSYAVFERRAPQVVHNLPSDNGPYWLLENGHKSESLDKAEVLQKMQDKTILSTDLISTDDGYTWQKIYHIECFDRRKPGELPYAPLDESFRQAKLNIAERIDVDTRGEELAQMAHLGQQKAKVFTIKIDEMGLDHPPHISPSLMWGVSAAAVGVVLFAVGGSFFFQKNGQDNLFADSKSEKRFNLPERPSSPARVAPAVVEQVPVVAMPIRRDAPASGPRRHVYQERSELTRNEFPTDGDMPTRIESHQANDRSPSNDSYDDRDRDLENREMDRDRDSEITMDSDTPGEAAPAVEHSLVANPVDQSLDGSMGRDPAQDRGQEQLPVEEISDF